MSGPRDAYTMNTIALAFLGDAVYEEYIRQRLIENGSLGSRADSMHRAAVAFVCAGAQARVIKSIFEELSEEEQHLVTRARNHRIATKPKNADAVTYKWATAFEALLGYLKLAEREDRLREIMDAAYEICCKKED